VVAEKMTTKKEREKKMNGVNKTILGGNLVADADSRVTQTGIAVTTFRVASTTREYYNNENHGETLYMTCVMFGKRGEALARKECLLKGQPVLLQGKLRNRSYTTQDGKSGKVTELIVGRDDQDFVLLARGQGSQSKPAEDVPPPPPTPPDFSE